MDKKVTFSAPRRKMYTKILRTLCALYGKRVHKAQTIFKLIIFYISVHVNSLQSFHILRITFLLQCTQTQHHFCTFCSPGFLRIFSLYELNINILSILIMLEQIHRYNSNSSRYLHIFGLSCKKIFAAYSSTGGSLINISIILC